jgi:hypothetical protein
MQTLLNNNNRSQPAKALPSSSVVPVKSNTHFFAFGGEKRMKDIALANAERELKGAETRFENEKKEYLRDFKLKTIYENDDKLPKRQNYHQGKDGDKQFQDDMKNFNKKVNAIVADEKFQMEERFKRLFAEATTNVYTVLFNQIRNNRPNFQKYDYI